MDIKPVKTALPPGYPDKYARGARQALVKARPYRWLHRPLIVGVLSATVALGLSGCDESIIGGPTVTMGDFPAPAPLGAEAYGAKDDEAVILGMPAPLFAETTLNSYIPLFEYGDGTGAIGCVAIAAPVFMSEEEAFAILAAAFAEAGLELDREATALEKAVLPVTDLYSSTDEACSATASGALIADGLLRIDQGLPVKFVSTADVENWQKKTAPGELQIVSSVSVYDVREAARILADHNPALVVFYDPLAHSDEQLLLSIEQEEGESDEDYWARWEAINAEAAQAAKVESEQLLREQAEAFVQWLRAEGVL